MSISAVDARVSCGVTGGLARLWPVFSGNLLIHIHKDLELADVETHFPASHDVFTGGKLRNLHAVKRVWGDRVTTALPRQGHYAADAKTLAALPPPGVTIDQIGQLLDIDLAALTIR